MGGKPKAGQRNGRKGGGPRTAAGKTTSCMNARKHGLTIPIMMDRSLHKTAFDLAYAIAGRDADGAMLSQALIVAECELILQRIDKVRVTAIEQAMSGASDQVDAMATTDLAGAFVEALPTLSGIERYERRAFSRQKKALAHLQDLQQLARLKF
jgi:hypothetical protein